MEEDSIDYATELDDLRTEVSVLHFERSQQPGTGRSFPKPAELLNQFKGQKPKSKTTLADIEAILQLLGD